MAKAKKQLAGNWELVGGGVFHKSWAGVVFRRRGSTGAYYEGCTFPHQPVQPPPPPQPPQVVWVVNVFFEDRSPPQLDLYHVTLMRFVDDVLEGYTTSTFNTLSAMSQHLDVTVLSKSVSADAFSKTLRIRWREPWGAILSADITIEGPPFNMVSPPSLPPVFTESDTV